MRYRWLIILPNILAGFVLMFNQALLANIIYVFGYLLMIWYNYKIDDKVQKLYFIILEIFAIIGVGLYYYDNYMRI